MSVESSKARTRYQEDLADLQAEYTRKKKKLNQSNEEEIDSLQEKHQNTKKALNLQNEAAVNHIQKTQTENIEKYSANRAKNTERGRQKLEDINQSFNVKVEEMQQNRADAITRINEEKKEKLQKIQNYSQAKINEARNEGKRELESLKNHYRSEAATQNDRSFVKLEEARNNNDRQINSEISRGEAAQEKVRNTYEKQIKKLHQDGDAQAQQEKIIADRKLQKVEDEYKKEYDKTYKSWTAREKYMQDAYAQKLEGQKETQEKLLTSQSKHFEKVYDKNDADQRTSLEIQEGNYTKQLLNQKRKFLRETTKYASKEDDPFYKIEDRGSNMRETSNSYIIEAYSPEHEKDLVRVTVDRGKAVISGQRAFDDKVEDEVKKITTNNYQSFREEFKFDVPVATEAMVRERRGDYIVFDIPKMSAVDSSTIKYSKKV